MRPELVARLMLTVLEGVKTKYVQAPDWPWEEIAETLQGLFLNLLRAEVAP